MRKSTLPALAAAALLLPALAFAEPRPGPGAVPGPSVSEKQDMRRGYPNENGSQNIPNDMRVGPGAAATGEGVDTSYRGHMRHHRHHHLRRHAHHRRAPD